MKRGFTLSEILITLGIIGIITAVTIPSLMTNFQKKSYEVGIKKAFNTVNTAVGSYMATEGIDDLANANFIGRGSSQQEELIKFVNKYFKVVRTCNNGFEDCFSEKMYSLDHSTSVKMSNLENRCQFGAVLADGVAMCFNPVATRPAANNTVSPTAMSIDIDINGITEPNTAGRDIFSLVVDCDGVTRPADPSAKLPISADTKKKAEPLDIGVIFNSGWEMKY